MVVITTNQVERGARKVNDMLDQWLDIAETYQRDSLDILREITDLMKEIQCYSPIIDDLKTKISMLKLTMRAKSVK